MTDHRHTIPLSTTHTIMVEFKPLFQIQSWDIRPYCNHRLYTITQSMVEFQLVVEKS